MQFLMVKLQHSFTETTDKSNKRIFFRVCLRPFQRSDLIEVIVQTLATMSYYTIGYTSTSSFVYRVLACLNYL